MTDDRELVNAAQIYLEKEVNRLRAAYDEIRALNIQLTAKYAAELADAKARLACALKMIDKLSSDD